MYLKVPDYRVKESAKTGLYDPVNASFRDQHARQGEFMT